MSFKPYFPHQAIITWINRNRRSKIEDRRLKNLQPATFNFRDSSWIASGFLSKKSSVKILFALLLVLSACAPASSSPTPILTPSPIPPLSHSPTPPSPTPVSPCTPLQGYTFAELPGITSRGFEAPHPGKDDGHHGIDIAHWQYKDRTTLEGVVVQAVLLGTVAASVEDKWPYGNMIIIETPAELLPTALIDAYQLIPGQSLYALYAHLLAPPAFTVGDAVVCAQPLGAVGNTGWSGNAHLHFETRVGPGGSTFASMAYYQTTTTEEERANYARWRFEGEFVAWDPALLLFAGE